MKNKVKKKIAISAEIRNNGNNVNGLHEYTITIKNEKGESGEMRAFGKDLQDALSRVNHDLNVEKINTKVIRKLPEVLIPIIWVLFLIGVVSFASMLSDESTKPIYISTSILTYVLSTLSISNWFNLKNINK